MRTPLLVPVLILALAAPSLAWESRTKGVRDGDSINVTNDDGVMVNIRLYGVDAPEAKQAFGYQAKKRLTQLVSRKNIQIENVDTDRYGRTVALVRLADGTLVNAEMVRSGLGWVYEQYCQREDLCASLRQSMAEAKSARRGLWAESDPTPPWEWRRQHKTEEWYARPLRAMQTIARKIKVVIQR
ncbi:MAG: thermonuclease family protein [Proteobacteria bacterium]|nr:thermonuclease family protein [Pseudomonadota bacterium]